MTELTSDLSILTTMPKAALDDLVLKAEWCICNNVVDNLHKEDCISEIDIGIGTLYIKATPSEILYKFVPCNRFEKLVAKCVASKESPIVAAAEKAISKRILSTYKELL